MTPVAASRTRHRAKPIDDFEWPPTADELSVYELGPDPWQKLQDASSQVFVARRREASQRRLTRVVDRAPQPPRRYWTLTRARVLVVSAVVAAAAGWIVYGAMTRPVPVTAIHHVAPPAVAITAPAPPPPITIVATYPVAAAAASTPLVDHDPGAAPAAAGSIAPDPEPASQVAPVDAPPAAETIAAPAETAAPADTPVAIDPGATPPAGVGPAPDLPGTGHGLR